jgi:STE24 endopeptidase
MNVYALIILITLIAGYVLDLFTNLLNLRHLQTGLPQEFKDIYDADRYSKSQLYTRVNTRFGFLTSGISLAVTLIFWFSGGFNYLDLVIRGFNLSEIWNGLSYIGALLVLRGILSLPFSIYSTFVIEARFGFNKTTFRTFILDIFKGLLLAIVLGGPLLAGILYFFQYAGPPAWIYCWLVVTSFGLIIQFIAPTWIMPLFNKFAPLAAGELREAIMAYAQKVQYSLRDIFIMDGSKRSTKSNAFFTGFGKNKRIALFDTLVQKHTVPELVAVLAHEIGHYKKKHILKSILIGILHTGLMFYLLSIFLSHPGLFAAFYMQNMSSYAGLLFFGMLYTPLEMILSIFLNIFSRRNEFQADHFAVETTGQSEAMINALKKLSVDNLSNLTPHPLYAFLNYSHPPVLQRIRRLAKFSN